MNNLNLNHETDNKSIAMSNNDILGVDSKSISNIKYIHFYRSLIVFLKDKYKITR